MNRFLCASLARSPVLLAGAALLSFGLADIAAAAPNWVDMGPIGASAQGHVWSKVVDEVGNTQGRSESWSLPQGGPSRIVVTLRAPNPADLDLRIKLRFPDGNTGEFRLPAPDKAIPGGFQQVISRAVPGPRAQGEVMAVTGIAVSPTKEFVDQRYQLTVEVTPLAGQPPATSSAVPSVDRLASRMQGSWNRYDNGTLVETLEVGRDPQGWRVRGTEPNGRTNIYRILSQANGWLEVSRPFGPEYGSRVRLDANGKLVWETYRKVAGSHVWTGSYDRVVSPRPSSAAPPASAPGSSDAPLRNLALGRPARQSSTYIGTGVDQSAWHAVDGLTSGRDPHDLIHTNYEDNPWWQVDLGGRASIVKLRLYNRRNPELRTNLQMVVEVSDDGSAWQTVYRHDARTWNVLEVPVGRIARLVRVALTNHDALQLYEIEVWGRTP